MARMFPAPTQRLGAVRRLSTWLVDDSGIQATQPIIWDLAPDNRQQIIDTGLFVSISACQHVNFPLYTRVTVVFFAALSSVDAVADIASVLEPSADAVLAVAFCLLLTVVVGGTYSTKVMETST